MDDLGTVVNLVENKLWEYGIKEVGKPFNAFGYSVSVSDQNIVIGAPIPLNDDFNLSGILITESGSRSNLTYLLTSSYQSEDCVTTSSFVYLQMEDCISCDSEGPISGGWYISGGYISGALSGACNNLIVFVDEQGDTKFASDSIFAFRLALINVAATSISSPVSLQYSTTASI